MHGNAALVFGHVILIVGLAGSVRITSDRNGIAFHVLEVNGFYEVEVNDRIDFHLEDSPDHTFLTINQTKLSKLESRQFSFEFSKIGLTEACFSELNISFNRTLFCVKINVIIKLESIIVDFPNYDVQKDEEFYLDIFPLSPSSDLCFIIHDDASKYIKAYGNRELCTKFHKMLFNALLFRHDLSLLHEVADENSNQHLGPSFLKLFVVLNFTTTSLEISYPFNIVHKVESPGKVLMTVIAWNGLSFRSKVHSLIVHDNIECKTPSLEIQDKFGRSISSNVLLYREKELSLVGFTEIQCKLSYSAKRYWDIYSLKNDVKNKVILKDIDLSKSTLEIPNVMLEVGQYEVHYTVMIEGEQLPNWLNKISSVFIKVSVKGNPFAVKLIPGDASLIELWQDSSVLLSPKLYSNFPEFSINIKYSWFCRRLPLKGFNDVTHIDFVQNVSNSFTAIKKSNFDLDPGECFNTKLDQLNIRLGEWNVHGSIFKDVNATYEIVVLVEINGQLCSKALQIRFVDSPQPIPIISCQKPELCQNLILGSLINPIRIGFKAACFSNCMDEFSTAFKWKISVKKNDSYVLLSNNNNYLTFDNQSSIAIKSDAFYSLSNFKDLLLTVELRANKQVGKAHIHLQINQVPSGGHCKSSTSLGHALLDEIIFSCHNFHDPDPLDVVISYQFWIKNLDSDNVEYLITDGSSSEVVRLPFGRYEIGTNVIDSRNGILGHSFGKISLLAPFEKDYDQFMSNEFPSILSKGDQSMINMVSNAAISLFYGVYGAPSVMLAFRSDEIIGLDPLKLENVQHAMTKEFKARSFLLKSINENINFDTIESFRLFGSALTSVIGTGEAVDEISENLCIKMFEKMIHATYKLEITSPQEAIDLIGYSLGIAGALINRLSDQLISRRYLLPDFENENLLQFPVDNPDSTDPYDQLNLNLETSKMKIEEQLITLSKLRKSKNVIENFLEKTDKLMKSIVANYLVPNELVHFRSMSNVEIAIGKFQLWQLTGLKITHGQSSIIFPEACSLFPRWKLCTGNETIIIMAITYPSILQPYALNTQLLENRTTTQQLKLYDQNFIEYEVKDTKQPLDIIISRRAFQRLDVKQSVPALQKYNRSPKQFEEMIYHKLEIKLDSSAVFIEIRLDEVLNDSVLYFRKNLKPTLKEFDEKFIISPKKKYGRLNTDEILISNAQNKYRPGLYYIGISRLELSDYPSNVSSKNFSLQYSLLILTSNCQFFDSTLNKWLTNGCYVHSISSLQTHCKCNHLTSFARGFVIEPNEIEFTYILANAGFLDNQAIYITISTILVLYILIFIWARRKDDTDLEKIGAHPLPENNKDNVFIYEIMVITGTQKESGTDSKVQFIVYGDYNNSGIRTFENPNQEILRSGGRDAFILTTSRSLGNLNYIRIWHDNSGKGKYASWFLKALAIKDVQTNKRWIFIANRWFSMDKIPAKIDHIVPSASMEQIQQFTNRFHTLSKQSISDDHIWLSVFYRPPRSRFNRKERLSCCLVILCLSMLVSAMWYDKVPSRAISGLKLGPLTISVEQMAVGILSNIIELPLSLFIIVLFQKSRLRKLRPSRFRDTLCQIREKLGPKYIVDRKFGWIDASYQKLPSNEKISFKGAALSISFISHLKNKKTFLFPWWCRYIAWLLVLVTITTSLFLVWGYGIMFGNEKTSKWLTSLVISFFSSILLTQPIKVFVSSLMFSLLCSSFDPYQDDADDDEEPPNLLKIEDYQQYELQFPTKKKLIRMRTVDKTHQKDLREARKERRKEIKMWKISAKYISYVFYLTVLLMICYVNNDPANFYYREHLKNSFIKSGDQFNDFLKINSDVRFWNWTRNALIPELKVGPLYNGNKPYGLRGFLNDHVSRILGYAVIRQIRVKDHDGNFSKSPGFSRIFNEDREDYNLSWIGKKRNDDEYTYRTSDELSGQLSFVKLDMYGGGGYTYKLLGPVDYLKSKITTLERSKWIDKRTRAVIVEFSVYNCQSNLFGVLAIYAEMFPGGGFVPSFKINIVRLLRYHQNFGLFVLLFEIFAFVVVMYFTYREVKLIIFMKKKYFNEFWNVLEGLSLVLSYVTILLYCYRHWLTSKILKTFSNSHGNAYVKLQEVAMIDEVLNYFLAFVTFIAILKIIRLTQFSSRMNLLHETLNHLRGDLSNYSVIFFVIFASFVQLFYLIFGSSILGFSNLLSASETTGSIMLGKFDFNEINRTSPYLGPSLFFLFSIVSKFIILNLLLTLIMTAFSKVKRKFRDGDELQVMTFIWMKLALWIGLPINFKKTNNMQNETNDKKPTNSQFSVEFCEEVFEKFTHFIQQKSFEI